MCVGRQGCPEKCLHVNDLGCSWQVNEQKGRLGHVRCVVTELGVVQHGSGLCALNMFELGRGEQIIKGSVILKSSIRLQFVRLMFQKVQPYSSVTATHTVAQCSVESARSEMENSYGPLKRATRADLCSSLLSIAVINANSNLGERVHFSSSLRSQSITGGSRQWREVC